MQILYWHLTRPQTSTCGGSLSPPLLQRRDNITSLSTGIQFRKFPNFVRFPIYSQPSPIQSLSLHPSSLTISGRNTGGSKQSHQRAMEIENDDQMPTFYLLNAVDLPEDEDSALNHHLDLIHGHHQNNHESTYSSPLVGNGSSGDGGGGGGGPPGGHYSDQLRKMASNKRKKRRSNDLARVLSIEDESDGDDDSFVNIGPSKSKKAKLVVNLYPEGRGYSFGYQLPGSNECSESHTIPYSERYLLDSIDNEQIPHKVVCRYEDKEGVHLMRYRNQVIAEIRDYRKSMSLLADTNSNTNPQVHDSLSRNNSASMVNGNLGGGSEQKKPVVKQVMLRPTTESLFCDFDMIVEKSEQERRGWSAVIRQSSVGGDVSHLVADGSDSEYEYEVDLEGSQRSQCNYLTYDQRLELERQFVNQTADPICLDPSPQVSTIANRMQYERFKWNTEELKATAKRWEENPFKTKTVVSTTDISLNAPSLAEGRLDISPFHNYVANVRTKKELSSRTFSTVDKDFVNLPQISFLDYPDVDPPRNNEEILRIGQNPEPAQLRLFPNENFVRKIEEYILETERRKRPHTTTLSIFQRNGMESYFGELEMESFLDPNQPRIGTAPSSTKCQFELGSSRNVTLYVKQFSDIFTEDGRRPCKITYQKVGQPPQVVYTNSYKPATPASQPAVTVTNATTNQQHQTQNVTSVSTTPQQTVTIASNSATNISSVSTVVTSSPAAATPIAHVVQTVVPAPVTTTASPAVPESVTVQQQSPQQAQATTTAPSLPPVQIVHPQPRTTPQLQQQQKPQPTTGQRQAAIQVFSQQPNQTQNIATSQTTTQTATNVNLNVNLSPQQVLTRPNIVNVNLQQQQQNAAAQQQLLQLTQQRILRMKQQQPNTALAKLLLSNLQQSKPITVAVQPTPQTPTSVANNNNGNTSSAICSSNSTPVNCATSCASTNAKCNTNITGNSANVSTVMASSPADQHQGHPHGSPLMIQSPPSVSSTITSPSPNVSVNVNASPNVSFNLNTISLDGLLAASSASMNYGSATLTTNQAGGNMMATSNVNLGLSRITTSSGQPAVNILRLNNNTGTVTSAGGNTVQLATVQRQFAALNGNVSILQQGRQQPQQRILINANSVNNLNLNSVGSSGDMDELSVPDLQTLLGGQPIQISQLGQQQHILANTTSSAPSQTTIDTTNLNLNLNVNLNSGTVVNNGDGQMQQHQIAKIQGGEWTTTAQAPPFLVFISPLRPMSIGSQGGAAVTRQVTTSTGTINNSSTLNLNLGSVQQQQQHQQSQIVQSQPGKVPEGPTRILLGTYNNGVAIKREVATSASTTSTVMSTATTRGSSGNTNSSGTTNVGQNQVIETANVDGHILDAQHGVGGSDVVVDGVDSLFNALSEAIGPEQLQKLDAIGGLQATTSTNASHHSSIPSSASGLGTMVESVPAAPPSMGDVTTSSIPSSISNTSNSAKNNSTNVITLSDLLGSSTVVSSSTGNAGSPFPSLILNSVSSNSGSSSVLNSSPTLSSLLNSATSTVSGIPSSQSASSIAVVTQSSLVSSTPRLSALLAGTPSADTTIVGANGAIDSTANTTIVDSSLSGVGGTGGTVNSASYGSLLDRLAASLNQPQGTTAQVRTGASRLNPIATATPSVVLEHPVLAATLTQQQQQQLPGSPTFGGVNRGTFRQIAPAPSSVAGLGNATATTSIASNNSNVTVINSSDMQSHTIQSPQLINLLGLVGNRGAGSGSPGQTRTIRISTSSSASNPSPGSGSR